LFIKIAGENSDVFQVHALYSWPFCYVSS